MDKKFARDARDLAISSVEKLNEIAKLSNDWESDEMKRMRKAIGLAMGRIETDILGEIYRVYKDLDDLA
ncbi:MAG: hypothetical protein EOS65_32625 [Mesorhizobium sp.]|uniref:hypothetical protein n=1 Tax=Mesorhizobium TaxID=68287 RepID=UPI000FEA23A7|nr:hypothetical protein [Mesorhizobium sp.]RWF29827.1 MAG: hypothetical protein EOS65_32625 [Mesorhizobium sp.]TIX10956.1 MAG: hypothetical protein E5V41_27925 [Mesorhizobium sp.]TJW08612.1 MAG: hypothetical protein E5W97_05180 [Mesorhizobium sp.]